MFARDYICSRKTSKYKIPQIKFKYNLNIYDASRCLFCMKKATSQGETRCTLEYVITVHILFRSNRFKNIAIQLCIREYYNNYNNIFITRSPQCKRCKLKILVLHKKVLEIIFPTYNNSVIRTSSAVSRLINIIMYEKFNIKELRME